MSKYKKPICDCHSELLLLRTQIVTSFFNIDKDGMPFQGAVARISDEQDAQRLYCNNCSNIYEVETELVQKKAFLRIWFFRKNQTYTRYNRGKLLKTKPTESKSLN